MTTGSEKRIRNRILPIRLSEEERQAVGKAAETAGFAVGSYARQILLGAPQPRQVRRAAIEKEVLSRLLGELGKIGGNLNQLAKATNQGLVVYQNEILVALGGFKVLREAIMRALGRGP